MCRSVGTYDKFFVIQDAVGASVNKSVDYDAASFDFNGDAMRGLPFASSIQKLSFCAVPGEYTMHAIDVGAHGWWGGAYYSVVVGGETVLHKEMGQTSSTKQSTTFEVALPESARTLFSDNKASQGGGGAVFWEHVPPENLELYRDDSTSNTALYGSYAATPAKKLLATSRTYNATAGASMTNDPIAIELKDR